MIYTLVQFIQQHALVNFIRQHTWHIITCHRYIHNICYTCHIAEQMTLHHHRTANYHQHASYLQKMIRHATTHPNRYHTYQMTLIQTQPHHNLLCRTHLTHQTPVIRNENGIHIRNSGEKGLTPTLLKIAPSSQPNYLRLHKILRPHNSNWTSILYSAGFISQISRMTLKLPIKF